MADSHNRMHMRTRSARGTAVPAQPGDRTQSSSSSEGGTDTERSSLLESESAVQLSANMPDLEEPVLSIGDKRIRSLIAQCTTEKMLVDNTLKDMSTQKNSNVLSSCNIYI